MFKIFITLLCLVFGSLQSCNNSDKTINFRNKEENKGVNDKSLDAELLKFDSSLCEEKIIEYHKNGIIKYKGCQGHFNSFGIPVGTSFIYDSVGILRETREHFYSIERCFLYKSTYLDGSIHNIDTIEFDPHFGVLD